MANNIPAGRTPDKISIDRLNKLHPKIRKEAIELFQRADAALTGRAQIRIVQGLRTFEEQAALYAQGRTKPGKIVTNAAPGKSFHNYALAIDFALLIDGREISWETGKDFDGDHVADWLEVVQIFKAAGWTWGGDFRSMKDFPHLEKTFGKSWSDLQKLYVGKHLDPAGYVIFG